MSIHSYGILLFRYNGGQLQVMLLHPGGPFFAEKDEGVWSIPKGLPEGNEIRNDATRRIEPLV